MDRITRIPRDEDGFTLVEVLIAMVLMMVVIGGAVMMFTAANANVPKARSQATIIADGRTSMERIVRELRESTGLVSGTTATPSHISIVTYVDTDAACSGAAASTAVLCSVTYNCAVSSCTRQVAKIDLTSPGPVVTVVSGLSSTNVFSCSPSCSAPTYIGATLSFPDATGGTPVTLTDGAAFRNAAGAGT
jgi:Tfp pilus assembly protein PilV